MRFIWDQAKNQTNMRKHGIDFEDVKSLFDKPMLVKLDDRRHYGEDRWIGVGLMRIVVCVVVYVEIKDDLIRIISARKATKQERWLYEQSIKN